MFDSQPPLCYSVALARSLACSLQDKGYENKCLGFYVGKSQVYNSSGEPRRGIVFAYRAADAYCLADGLHPDSGLQICGVPSRDVRCDAGLLRMPARGPSGVGEHGEMYRQHGGFAIEANRLARL